MSVVYRIMFDDCESGSANRRLSFQSNHQLHQQPQMYSANFNSPFQVKSYQTLRTKYIWIIPLMCALVFPFFCTLMYIIALSYGHIEAVWPYISDTGALPPEAGFFDQFMDIAAILVTLTGYIRYKQVKFYIDTLGQSQAGELKQLYKLYHINLYSLLSLYPCSIGLMLIGNFRTSEIQALHLFGNVLILGIVVSVLFQIYICRQLWSDFGIESAPRTMTFMLAVGVFFTVLTFTFTYTSFFSAGLENAFNFNFGLHWTRDKPGYLYHCLGTITEWLAVAVAIPFYFVCLFRRMKHFHQWERVWK